MTFFRGKSLAGLLRTFQLPREGLLLVSQFLITQFLIAQFLIEPINLFLEHAISFLKRRHHGFLFDDLFFELLLFLNERRVVRRTTG